MMDTLRFSPEVVLVFCAAVFQSADAKELDRDKLRRQIAIHEGKRNKVYKDSLGIPTVGIGFNLTRPDAKSKISSMGLDYEQVLAGNQVLSDQQIASLLDSDIAQSVHDCRSIFVDFDTLPDVRQRVLVDMMFDLGKARFARFRLMIAAVKRRDYSKAAVEMKDSRWYRQVKSRGRHLVEMMRTGRDVLDLE